LPITCVVFPRDLWRSKIQNLNQQASDSFKNSLRYIS
jgi:hypothetical protein